MRTPRKLSNPPKLSILLVLLVPLAFACAEHQPQSLLVRGNLAWDGCGEATGSQEGPFLPKGYLDIALTQSYFMAPVVDNVMPEVTTAQAATTTGALNFQQENHELTLDGAAIRYTFPSQLSQPSENLFVHASFVLSPESIGPLPIEAIPASIGRRLANEPALREKGAKADILVHVTVHGHMTDGVVVKSNEFTFPIEVCNGCLTFNSTGDCSNLTDLQSALNVPCKYGQDQPVDCRVCYLFEGDAERCDPFAQ